MPAPADSERLIFQTEGKQGIEILNKLTGKNLKANRQGICYLIAREGKANKNGIIYDPGDKRINGLYDPWGKPYYIIFAHDGGEPIDVKIGGTPVNLDGHRSIVFSAGPDGILGTHDDVNSSQKLNTQH